MELSVTLAGIKLEHPLMNAAGTCKTTEHVAKLARSAVSAVMVGSITVEERLGNEGSVFWFDAGRYSLNSLGLPNRGAAYYREQLPSMASIAHEAGKPLFVSVAGFNPDEYTELTRLALEGGADLVELNLGCPNVWDKSSQKRITSFDPSLVSDVLDGVYDAVKHLKGVVGVKLSPFSDPVALAELAAVLSQHAVPVVTTANTFPNATSRDPSSGRPVTDPGGGLAGLAGSVLKPVSLGQVQQLRSMLPDKTQLVGVGGIRRGQDIVDYQSVGATAVQVATAYYANEDPTVFSDIIGELVDLKEA